MSSVETCIYVDEVNLLSFACFKILEIIFCTLKITFFFCVSVNCKTVSSDIFLSCVYVDKVK